MSDEVTHARINAAWHKANPMPKRPTLQQRIDWHVAHQENCSCRPIPAKLAAELMKRGMDPTKQGLP
jgi:hypothetical protein